jgi:hypothetical protein
MNPHTPKGTPTLGVGVLVDSQIFRKRLQGSKLIGLKHFLYHWKALGTQVSKMGSHDPFGCLKHKLWSKEGSRVKLSIWLPTTKNQESPRFPCFQIVEKLSTRAKNFLYASYQSEVYKEIYGPLKSQESQVREFRDSHLGVSKQNAIWMWASWIGTKYTIRGKVVASPKSRLWWVLWIRVCLWFILTPKVLKLCTNQLVVWFVQICVSNWCLSLFLIPIPEL